MRRSLRYWFSPFEIILVFLAIVFLAFQDTVFDDTFLPEQLAYPFASFLVFTYPFRDNVTCTIKSFFSRCNTLVSIDESRRYCLRVETFLLKQLLR